MGEHVTARQLHLFKGKRQRGAALPGPSEYQLHCMVVDTVKRWRAAGWIFMHPAAGEKRDQVTAARLKRMGVVAGFPDLVFFSITGEVCAVDLKASGGRLSEAQIAVKGHFEQAGRGYLCSDDYRDIVETLKGWDVLRACVNVQ